jgi:hypothetical protein
MKYLFPQELCYRIQASTWQIVALVTAMCSVPVLELSKTDFKLPRNAQIVQKP